MHLAGWKCEEDSNNSNSIMGKKKIKASALKCSQRKLKVRSGMTCQSEVYPNSQEAESQDMASGGPTTEGNTSIGPADQLLRMD